MNQSIQSMVRSYQDQQLNNEELEKLDELLRTDANAREIFIRETNLIAGLDGLADEQNLGSVIDTLRMQDPGTSINLANRWTMATGGLVAALAAMQDNLPSSASDPIVELIWCHTLYQRAGLAITSVKIKEQSE